MKVRPIDLGLPSGVMWASCNMDLTQPNKMAASPFQYNCSFVSWGNKVMHNPQETNVFRYDWGSINSASPWYEGQPYGETIGCSIQSNLSSSQDIAREVLGENWRMPDTTDTNELIEYTDFVQADGSTPIPDSNPDKRIMINGVRGIYLKSKINDALLFIPCCGVANSGKSWVGRGSSSTYWTRVVSDEKDAVALYISASSVGNHFNRNRYIGAPIRPVFDPNGQ